MIVFGEEARNREKCSDFKDKIAGAQNFGLAQASGGGKPPFLRPQQAERWFKRRKLAAAMRNSASPSCRNR